MVQHPCIRTYSLIDFYISTFSPPPNPNLTSHIRQLTFNIFTFVRFNRLVNNGAVSAHWTGPQNNWRVTAHTLPLLFASVLIIVRFALWKTLERNELKKKKYLLIFIAYNRVKSGLPGNVLFSPLVVSQTVALYGFYIFKFILGPQPVIGLAATR